MSDPVLAGKLKRSLRQWDVAVFVSLATADVNHHSSRVNGSHLKMSAFLESQPARVDSSQTGSIARQADERENQPDFIAREDDGELLFARRANQFEGSESFVEGMLVEELDTADCDGGSGARVVLDVLEVEEVLSEFFVSNEVRGLVEMLGELADGSDLALLSAFGVSSELKRLDHSLAKFSHGYTS